MKEYGSEILKKIYYNINEDYEHKRVKYYTGGLVQIRQHMIEIIKGKFKGLKFETSWNSLDFISIKQPIKFANDYKILSLPEDDSLTIEEIKNEIPFIVLAHMVKVEHTSGLENA
jgi:hypothetical protein